MLQHNCKPPYNTHERICLQSTETGPHLKLLHKNIGTDKLHTGINTLWGARRRATMHSRADSTGVSVLAAFLPRAPQRRLGLGGMHW